MAETSQRTVSRLTQAAFAVTMFVLVVNGFWLYGNTSELKTSSGWVQHTQEVLLSQQRLLTALSESEALQRAYLMSGDQKLLSGYAAAKGRALEELDTLTDLVKDNQHQIPRVERLRALTAERFRGLDANQALGPTKWEAGLFAASARVMEQVRNLSDEVGHEEQGLLEQREVAYAQNYRAALTGIVVSAVAALAAVLMGFYLLNRDTAARRRLALEQQRLAEQKQAAATEREQAAAEQEKLARYNALILDSTGEGIFGTDPTGRLTFINRAAEAMLGVKAAQDAIGVGVIDLLKPSPVRDTAHGEKEDGVAVTAERFPVTVTARTGEPARGDDYTFSRLDGSRFPVEYSAFPIQDKKRVAGAVVSFADISKRKQAEAIRAEQLTLSALTSDVGRAIIQNDTLPDMLGHCAQALVEHLGVAFARVWTLDKAEDVLELRASAGMYTHLDGPHGRVPVGQFKIGRIAQERKPHLTNSVADDPQIGDHEWAAREGMVAFAGYPLIVAGHLVGVIAVFARHELSEAALRALAIVANGVAAGVHRKQVEDDLRGAVETAEAANLAKSQFLANMSHELRTPLNAVILYSELLQEEAEDRGIDDFGPDLEKIRTAGKHLLSLVNGVLDLSKIEAGKMDLYLEDFDLASMLDDVASTVAPLVEKKGNTLEIVKAGDIGRSHSDLTKTRQILFNLLSNAAKFTENGTITLRAERYTLADTDILRYTVLDSGIGMTDEQLGRLFQPFTQADESTTRKYGGTGLGLTICRHFAQMLGGDIVVASTPDVGTTFTVELPAVVAPPAGTAEMAALAVPPADGAVLVVDDNAETRQFLIEALAKEGLAAVAAADGEEALRLARQFRPAAIFLDVIMPRMDGWAVLRAIKRDAKLKDVPVIMLTIAAGKELSYTLGAAEYLMKPVDHDELSAVIRRHCEGVADAGVLVVDDDESTRHAVRRALTRSGFAVDEAANGREALQKTASRIYSLVILDLVMPELDGFGFLKEFRNTPNGQSVPVVIATSKDLTPGERARLNGQVEAVLQKGGYSLEELQAEIHRLAGRIHHTPHKPGPAAV